MELEYKRLNYERDLMLAFERESRLLFHYDTEQELYFVARHFGIPSRLLDWSINPLVSLFMCVFPERRRAPRGEAPEDAALNADGVLYAMNPEYLGKNAYIHDQHDVNTSRDIESVTEWKDPFPSKEELKKLGRDGARWRPRILPIRPHVVASRLDRQAARFTLHCYGAPKSPNLTLEARRVPADCKERIRGQLERIGINEFTVYNTLDRLGYDLVDRFSGFLLHAPPARQSQRASERALERGSPRRDVSHHPRKP